MHDGITRHTTSPLETPRRARYPATPAAARSHSREGERAAPPWRSGFDVGLDVGVDPGRLPEERHDGRVPIRGNSLCHGGRRSYQERSDGPPASRSYARIVLVTLCGGVGAARMLSGLVRVAPPADITAVVNVGDDMVLHGLHISPDLDTVTYTLAGMDNRDTGWGVAGESWAVMDELARLDGEDWFRLGDRDLATHLFRTGRLRRGEPLSSVTAELCRRRGVAVRMLPVTDDPAAHPGHPGRGEQHGTARDRGRVPGLLRPPPPRRDRQRRPVRGRSLGPPGARGHGVPPRRGGHRRVPVQPRGLHRARCSRCPVSATP